MLGEQTGPGATSATLAEGALFVPMRVAPTGFEPVFQSRPRFRHISQPLRPLSTPPNHATRPKHAVCTIPTAHTERTHLAADKVTWSAPPPAQPHRHHPVTRGRSLTGAARSPATSGRQAAVYPTPAAALDHRRVPSTLSPPGVGATAPSPPLPRFFAQCTSPTAPAVRPAPPAAKSFLSAPGWKRAGRGGGVKPENVTTP
jgi:hypothetical protein